VGLDAIRERVRALTGWLLASLPALRHANGRPLVEIHGPRDPAAGQRGGTLTLNLHDPRGRAFDVFDVERRANRHKISLRTGCFCNPGASEIAHYLPAPALDAFLQTEPSPDPASLNAHMLAHYGRPAAATRVSLGLASNFADVFRFYEFARGYLNREAP
jgi:selenocysteine lyase/cysteine desulfurase